MKTIYTLFFIVFSCTVVKAQHLDSGPMDQATLTATFMSGAQLIEFSTAREFKVSALYDQQQLSSSSREFVKNTPYNNWQSVQMLGFRDNRYVLQHLEQAVADGWRVASTDYAHIPHNYDYGISATNTLLYQLERPARSRQLIKEVSGQLTGTLSNFRVRIWQQEQLQWVELDRQVSNDSWQNLVTNHQLLPQRHGEPADSLGILFKDRYLEIGLALRTEEQPAMMRYRFALQDGEFILVGVVKQAGVPCGEFEQATYQPLVGSLSIVPGREICSLNEGSRLSFGGATFNGSAERRPGISFGNLSPGSYRVRIVENRADFVF